VQRVLGDSVDLGRLIRLSGEVQINMPLQPREASGTSGMKAAFEGVLDLTVLDGWCIGDVAPGENHATARYAKLVQVVSSLYYGNRAWWIAVMKGAIAKNASFFNRQRMLSRYPSDAKTR
jgi:starch phosphorylase